MADGKAKRVKDGGGDAIAKGKTVQRFMEALRQLESNGAGEALIGLFGEECSLDNVQLEKPLTGREGATRYWGDYRETFRDVESRFTRVTEAGDCAVLEWATKGTLKTGRPISYRGASVLTIRGNEVRGFMAYFDTRAFTEHL